MVEQHIGSFVLPETAQVFSSRVSFSCEIIQQKELKERRKKKVNSRFCRETWELFGFFILFFDASDEGRPVGVDVCFTF